MKPSTIHLTSLAAAICLSAFAASAHANCVDPASLLARGPSLSRDILVPSVTSRAAGPGLTAAGAPGFASNGNGIGNGNDNSNGNDAIVGLWLFTFTSQGNETTADIPDGALLDRGYTQWHSDGTEIMNSSRDPVTSSFCLGVWKTVRPRTYALNHFALSWDNTGRFCQPVAPATNCFVGPTNIREQVAVERDSYSGTVTIDQFDRQGNLTMRLQGLVAGTRIDP